MMFISFMLLIGGFLGLLMYFQKKLICLLMLELCFISVVYLFFFHCFSYFGGGSFPALMILVGFMVMDSVLGLCLLLSSSRGSTSFNDPFFGF